MVGGKVTRGPILGISPIRAKANICILDDIFLLKKRKPEQISILNGKEP